MILKGGYESIVRLQIPIHGELDVPLDHAEALYAGLCRICPFIHESEDIRISPIKGKYTFGNHLIIADRGSFFIQTPAIQLPHILPIAGRAIELGKNRYRLGTPNIYPLTPAETLAARIVVVRGKQTEKDMQEYLSRAIQIRFGAMLQQDYLINIMRRRIFTLHSKIIFGFGVVFSELFSEELSLQIQASDLTGRGKYGAGFFLPGSFKPASQTLQASVGEMD